MNESANATKLNYWRTSLLSNTMIHTHDIHQCCRLYRVAQL